MKNATYSAYGERAVRWIEYPEAIGLRFVGLAHDVGGWHRFYGPAVSHTGWYLSDDNWTGETVSGVVYQLPAKNGRARYLYGFADPFNCDSEGRGPACLSLEVVEGEALECSYDVDSELRTAARWGDSMAERYADEAREYHRAWQAGSQAREAAQEMRGAGAVYVARCRALREMRGSGNAIHEMRLAILDAAARLRDLRDVFLDATMTRPDKRDPLYTAWAQGYGA